MANQKIYIADDDDNIREAIKAFLENEGYQVKDFADGDSLYAAFLKEESDLVILDVMMPGSDGFAICRQIRENSTVPIIMLTARDSDFDYAKGISLGSDDYFTKPFSPMALVMRVKAIFRRIEFDKAKQDPEQREEKKPLLYGDVRVDLKAKKVSSSAGEMNLTPNEYDLLCFLIRHADEAVSRDELLTQVWGFETEIESRATDDTVRRLRKKLEDTELQIDAVWGYGFKLRLRSEG